ncbi:cell wall-binding repeat-containing protein [Peptacetobacter hiranonis]|uniref:cell wall-binding repeat-containing protein n=1 Tax=Peptacetobacter hiranonis TaxID=89152 RepID=UPI002E784723|nr:cell wall-binding repeat-containing protein [Peptacetobacter hiranonis]MEE0248127.1 cell wall-binding repeat-containing protein [Peptacetobacter hiranonis]
MNKKRLSVVMAGAMLASSVAPIMAEETTNKVELTAAQKGELANSLTEKIWNADRFSEKDGQYKGYSVYGIQINDEAPIAFAESHKQTGSETKLEAAIKAAFAAANSGKGLLVGDVVKLVDLGTEKRTVDGKEELFSQFVSSTYTKEEVVGGERVANSIEKQFETLRVNDGFTSVVDLTKSGYDSKENGFVVTFKSGVTTFNSGKALVIKEGSTRYNFNYFKNNIGEIVKFESGRPNPVDNFRGFLTADSINLDIAETIVEATEITSGGDTYKLSDLYDGLFLTTKGYELLNNAKEVESILLNSKNTNNHAFGEFIVKVDGKDSGDAVSTNKVNGKYQVVVEIANPIDVANKVKGTTQWNASATKYDKYTISADSVRELETFVKWLNNRDAAVDKIEGEDRYATAVRIAKEVNLVGRKATDTQQKTKDIVLVNGSALVDGLAAAPLAGSLTTADTKAPILLTAKNELPKVTQRYLRELIDLEGNKDITVHIVGGEGVVSNNVKKQLRSLGLNVERYAGEDREETSMAVAKEIGFENGAFVIGAEGEADAMSVSGLAAANKAPVVVSGFNGLSEDTIDALDGVRVNVIGGDSRVSKADYEEVAAVAESIRRVEGEDRKATNAAVINTFYKNSFREADSVIVTRDDELVDALASANLASIEGAPIVLGTKSLSKDQINAVVANAKTADKVYQIGGLVERNVVKVVAEALKLVNNEK